MYRTGPRQSHCPERGLVIRVNDRLDQMAGLVDIPGAEPAETLGTKRAFTVGPGEFAARLATAGAHPDRFAIAIGDPDDTEEGVAPDMWFGIVEKWAPAGSRIRVVCRPARNVEEIAATLLPTGGAVGTPRTGGIG